MSHLHIPDGVLPLWLVTLGWLLVVAGVGLATRFVTEDEQRRRIPLVGAVAALMLVAMSSEIVPIAYHINLTVVSGILLGPWLSIPTALVVVTILALIGHGGVTVIGLNTVIIAIEMVLGGALFALGSRVLGRERAGWSAGAATVLTLAATTGLLVGVVAVTGPLAATRESGALDPQTLRFENPFAHGVFGNAIFGHDEAGGAGSAGGNASAGSGGAPGEAGRADAKAGAHEGETAPGSESVRLGRFALIVFGLGSIGWVIEALVTAGIIGFIARVRPGLVFERAAAAHHATLTHEGGHHR